MALKFPPQIYEGLRLPSGPTKEVKFKVREIIVKPKLTNDEIKAREGTYFDEKEIDEIIKEDADIYRMDNGQKKLLAKFRKNVFTEDEIRTGWEAFYQTAAPSRNRGAAAGPIDTKSNYWSKRKPVEINGWSARYMQDGKPSKMRVNNNVMSSVLGYFEKTPFMKLPCRLTSYTQRFFRQYTHGIPFIEAIDEVFKKLVPDAHKVQLTAASKKPYYKITKTAFSSVTLNRNFRTALHIDAGDFKEGFGNLCVIERGEYTGGYTLFPQYGIGIDLRTGDFLAMDVHQWHCNTEMTETAAQAKANKELPDIYKDNAEVGTKGSNKNFTRISFVCYLREKLRDCDESETRKYYTRIHFDPKKGDLKKYAKTRKHNKTE
ncbi:MAG: hypothetical protein EBV68_04240 [Betaproteobacteria bacterium]|nr:hypothetical protein [Betaproteobacteria bacterium]